MSFTHCALSGVLLSHPVVSKKSGYVFEKSTIEKHIEAVGQCPITGVELKLEDLVEINLDKVTKPRPINTTSIPGLISLLQTEWD